MLTRLRTLASLYRELGPRWSVFRLAYAFRLRTGLICLQMPMGEWENYKNLIDVRARSARPTFSVPNEYPPHVPWKPPDPEVNLAAYFIGKGMPLYFSRQLVRLGRILLLGGDLQTHIAANGFMPVLGIFIISFLVSGGQEELGFRGFAQPKLQEKFSPVITSLIIGVLWFFWHLPLYIWIPSASQYGQSLVFGLLAQISFCFTFTWIYNRTKSILLPMLLNATINSLGSILLVDVSGSQALIIAWAGVILPYFIFGTRLIWRDGNKYQAASIPTVDDLAQEK